MTGTHHVSRGLSWVEVDRPAAPPPPRGGRTRPPDLEGARIALCHEWTLRAAGSEKVASSLAELLQPDAVFTLAADPAVAAEVFPGARVFTPTLGLRPGVHARWDRLLPLLHLGWRSLDLSGYDLVVTSSHSCVNAVRTGPSTHTISYCHTPMRYAWAWREELRRVPPPLRPLWPAVAGALRAVDRRVARQVDTFVANSSFVADRVHTAYGVAATVVHPPVDTEFFAPSEGSAREGYFLVAGRLVDYKRPDLAVEAARRADVDLVVAGDGPVRPRLEALAGPRCRFVTAPSDEQLRDLYRGARALVFPGVEDFGITPVEAMACGTPVLCQAVGGAAESVVDGTSGRVLARQSVEGFADALRAWPSEWSREACRTVAEGFSAAAFRTAMGEVLAADGPHDRAAVTGR